MAKIRVLEKNKCVCYTDRNNPLRTWDLSCEYCGRPLVEKLEKIDG